jgi:hypothetical protein
MAEDQNVRYIVPIAIGIPTSVLSEEKYWVSFKEADDYET